MLKKQTKVAVFMGPLLIAIGTIVDTRPDNVYVVEIFCPHTKIAYFSAWMIKAIDDIAFEHARKLYDDHHNLIRGLNFNP